MSHSLTGNAHLHPIVIAFLYVQRCRLLNLDNCRCIFSYSETLLSVTVTTSYVFKYEHLDGCVAMIVSIASFRPLYQNWPVFLLQELSKNKSAIFSQGEWIFVVLISPTNIVCIGDFDSSSSGSLPVTCQWRKGVSIWERLQIQAHGLEGEKLRFYPKTSPSG